MRKVVIPGTMLEVSRFSFGTASLHHVGSVRKQRAHLESALDAGFTHFDTAPLYGFGGAERAVGDTFGTSAKVTVATKVGLYPPGGSDQSRATMLIRKIAGRVVPKFTKAEAEFSVARARASLDSSLRRLRKDRIDLLLLHEPNTALVSTEEWVRWLEDEAARVGTFGIAGPGSVVSNFVATASPLAKVVQTRDSLVNCEAEFMAAFGRKLQFTYGYMSGENNLQSGVEILGAALKRNICGSVVVSTRNRERLLQYSEIASAEA